MCFLAGCCTIADETSVTHSKNDSWFGSQGGPGGPFGGGASQAGPARAAVTMPFTNGGFCSPPAHTSFPSYRALSPTPPDTVLTSFAGNLDLAMVLTRRGRSTGGGDKPARPARKEKVPEKQTPAVLALCAVGILLAFVAFLLGCGGVAVLMGAPRSPAGPDCLPGSVMTCLHAHGLLWGPVRAAQVPQRMPASWPLSRTPTHPPVAVGRPPFAPVPCR